MQITIRQANREDWQIIQKLNYEVFDDNSQYDKHLDLGWVYSTKGESYFKKATKNRKFCTLIAEDDRKPIGYLIGYHKKVDYRSVKTAEIDNIGVSPAYRSQGIGTQLETEFMHWAKRQDFQTIFVNAYYKNNRGIKFYRKIGFTPIDISLEHSI